MSDHVDGPRSIGEPAADVTDLFAFTSPENPARTVLAMCVFPSAGEDAIFSNVIDHSIVVRRVTVAGVGNAAKFQPADDEIRFSFRFEVLKRDARESGPARRLQIAGRSRAVAHGERRERGVDAGGRCPRVRRAAFRPVLPRLDVGELKKVPNLLQHDNVLCIVVELDTRRVLDPAKGSLFGVIAETVPIPRPPGPLGYPVRRIDWVGRPEQTNMRLNNPAMSGVDDIRDLWNQQTPFAIPKELQPLFLQRLKDSFADWDMLDGKADWTPEALAANANVFLDDFLLFDVAKPITDQSHLEIEKSTIYGRPYQTGGGRTVDANVDRHLLTWLVNRDREFLQGGATGATKPGMKVFPYFATPNTELQTVAESVELAAPPDEVWSVIGQFNLDWHPAGRESPLDRRGNRSTPQGSKRATAGKSSNAWKRSTTRSGSIAIRWSPEFPLPITPARSKSSRRASGCVADWRVQFLANNATRHCREGPWSRRWSRRVSEA